jgi:Ni/Co efflux regulator RcnB
MKRAALIATLIASLATGSAAMAGPGGRGHDDHHGDARAHHGARHDFRRQRDDFRWAPPARGMHRSPNWYGAYRHPHGYYGHRWVRGERLPFAYFARPYVIADYRDCGLRRPPRGSHWVRVDRDAVLVAAATGIVLDTVFRVFN